MGSIHCEHCTGHCCNYLALPLDEPTTMRDFDDLRWYVMHQGVTIFVEDGDWYIQFATTCNNLGLDKRCTIYETRPKICREYQAGECDYAGGDYGYDQLFTHVDQIERFAKKKLGSKWRLPRQPAQPRRRRNGRQKREPARRARV